MNWHIALLLLIWFVAGFVNGQSYELVKQKRALQAKLRAQKEI
jgi:hypothetical protein